MHKRVVNVGVKEVGSETMQGISYALCRVSFLVSLVNVSDINY